MLYIFAWLLKHNCAVAVVVCLFIIFVVVVALIQLLCVVANESCSSITNYPLQARMFMTKSNNPIFTIDITCANVATFKYINMLSSCKRKHLLQTKRRRKKKLENFQNLNWNKVHTANNCIFV